MLATTSHAGTPQQKNEHASLHLIFPEHGAICANVLDGVVVVIRDLDDSAFADESFAANGREVVGDAIWE